ncbi:hypothetical protein EPUL_000515 [Erysiphe pulchra]|uniref:Uncharacterized protein n=1 Tax=Erysiphe pulchra TaxID=225359 RepID=A0A2S4Q0E2_9PEZI|nr:hypothetical protein EPUL_000515 [Erysiphe pulchra]
MSIWIESTAATSTIPSTLMTKLRMLIDFSLSSKILPLIVLVSILLLIAFVIYQINVTVQKISSETSNKMQTKNIFFTRDGVTVGVKELKNERYIDVSQNFLVKTWNLNKWPTYTRRLKFNSWRRAEATFRRRSSPSPIPM